MNNDFAGADMEDLETALERVHIRVGKVSCEVTDAVVEHDKLPSITFVIRLSRDGQRYDSLVCRAYSSANKLGNPAIRVSCTSKANHKDILVPTRGRSDSALAAVLVSAALRWYADLSFQSAFASAARMDVEPGEGSEDKVDRLRAWFKAQEPGAAVRFHVALPAGVSTVPAGSRVFAHQDPARAYGMLEHGRGIALCTVSVNPDDLAPDVEMLEHFKAASPDNADIHVGVPESICYVGCALVTCAIESGVVQASAKPDTHTIGDDYIKLVRRFRKSKPTQVTVGSKQFHITSLGPHGTEPEYEHQHTLTVAVPDMDYYVNLQGYRDSTLHERVVIHAKSARASGDYPITRISTSTSAGDLLKQILVKVLEFEKQRLSGGRPTASAEPRLDVQDANTEFYSLQQFGDEQLSTDGSLKVRVSSERQRVGVVPLHLFSHGKVVQGADLKLWSANPRENMLAVTGSIGDMAVKFKVECTRVGKGFTHVSGTPVLRIIADRLVKMIAVFREGNSDVVDQIKRRINESKTALRAVVAGITVHVGLGAGAGGYETPYDLRFEVADRTYGVTKTNLVYVVRARLPYFNRQYPWYKEPVLKLPVAAETAEKFISRVGHAIVTDLAPKIQAIEAEKAEKERLARIKWENGDD